MLPIQRGESPTIVLRTAANTHTDRLLAQRPALIEAQQGPGILEAHRGEHVAVGKFLDPEDHIAEMVAAGPGRRVGYMGASRPIVPVGAPATLQCAACVQAGAS